MPRPISSDRQLDAIIGLEIPIIDLVGKVKVSQNRPPGDREGVAEGLRETGGEADAAMAELMRERQK